MSSMRVASLCIHHLLGVTVISGDGQGVVVLGACGEDRADGGIGGPHGLDCGREDSGVADHVGRSEVAHDKVVGFYNGWRDMKEKGVSIMREDMEDKLS